VEVQPPTPADGLSQYVSNASQLGLLTVVIVAASALAFDSRREMAIFLRTRVTSVRAIVLPAYTVNVVAATACMVLGTLTAWYETVLLLGQLPAGAILVGLVLGAVYLAATVAVVALVASLAPSLLATAGISLAILIGMVIVGGLGNVGSYLPTNLAGAMVGLARGASATTYLPATGISIVLIGAALAGAVHFGARREL
jgi:ABC-2 type transport system permease protein